MSGGEDGLVKHWPDDWGRPRGVFAHRAMVRGVSVLHGQGTLGWTHGAGSGKALAELISGKVPDLAFGFTGRA